MGDLLDQVQSWQAVLAVFGGLVGLSGWAARRLRAMRRGRPDMRYRSWFLETYGTYDNPYLDATQQLHLDRTYIPIQVTPYAGADQSTHADQVVGEVERVADAPGHVILVGDAGAGKTTALQAYGVSLLRRKRMVPFFVQVRRFAAPWQTSDLAAYLVENLAAMSTGHAFSRDEARDLVAGLLRENRLVVLLDGLDEVEPDRYEWVRRQMLVFTRNRTPEFPTANARFVVTSRRHNFLQIADDWVRTGRPDAHQEVALTPHRGPTQVYAVAPLGDAEIEAYLDRFRGRFQSPDGPERFMAELRRLKLLSLHRTPLVLSMSVGLFAGRREFHIPHTIGGLYETMIGEMLDRHTFRQDERSIAVNRFHRDDKYDVLRGFALEAALSESGLGPFDRAALDDFAHTHRHRLMHDGADDTKGLVHEIVERSGLLRRDVDGRYQFIHRAIQEHLAARDLERLRAEGERIVLAHAGQPAWRLVTVYYTAMVDHEVATRCLTALADLDPILACRCLAGANCDDDTGRRIVARVERLLDADRRARTNAALAAVLRAMASPRAGISGAAREVVLTWVTRLTAHRVVDAIGGTHEGALDVAVTLIDRINEPRVSDELVTRMAAIVPDDPRLVGPLWRRLGTQTGDPVEEIVDRLLILAADPACFRELQAQQPHHPPFADDAMRARVYPFAHGLDRRSNLVTLLCWAEQYRVTCTRPNLFLRVKAADPEAWARLEDDRRDADRPRRRMPVLRRETEVSRAERILGGVLSGAAGVALIAITAGLLRPDGGLGPAAGTVALVLAVAELGLAVALLGVRVRLRDPGETDRAHRPDVYGSDDSRHWLVR